MKEMKVIYSMREIDDKVSVSRKTQDVSDADAEEVFFLILTDMIDAFKESGAPKSLTKEMMNKVIDTVYKLHPKHLEK